MCVWIIRIISYMFFIIFYYFLLFLLLFTIIFLTLFLLLFLLLFPIIFKQGILYSLFLLLFNYFRVSARHRLWSYVKRFADHCLGGQHVHLDARAGTGQGK